MLDGKLEISLESLRIDPVGAAAHAVVSYRATDRSGDAPQQWRGTDTFTLRIETNKVAGYGEWEFGSQRLDRDDDRLDLQVVCVLPAPPSHHQNGIKLLF